MTIVATKKAAGSGPQASFSAQTVSVLCCSAPGWYPR
jgi:hypothetical protein